MTFPQFFEIIAGILLSLGGGGAIVAGLAQYVGKRWADRGLEKQKQEYAQLNIQFQSQIELASRRIQVELDRLSYLHKLRTEQEFIKLDKLWKGLVGVTLKTGLEASQLLSKSVESNIRQRDFLEELKQFRQFAMDEAMLIPEPIFRMVREVLTVMDGEARNTIEAITLTEVGGSREQYAAVTSRRAINFAELSGKMDRLEPMIRAHLSGSTDQQEGTTQLKVTTS